ncbi:MAG: hypothetical protein IJN86_08520 [Clostridia bacterium]|nr:hypothetical protein [Clostridia bacterium]MBQ7048978.1 hypothetical protein [Clostridia bacterium]
MKKYFAFALALIMMLSVAACGGDEGEGEESSPYVVMTPFGPSPQFDTPIVVDPDDPFTGTWEDEEEGIMSVFYTFTGDGRGVVDITDIRYYFEYSFEGSTLTLRTYPDTMDEYQERVFEYKVEGNMLHLTDTTGTDIWRKYIY